MMDKTINQIIKRENEKGIIKKKVVKQFRCPKMFEIGWNTATINVLISEYFDKKLNY